MEKIKPLKDFFCAIRNDGRISVTHIGIYAALVQYWSENGYHNPFPAFCHQVMEIAKISHATYRKCINELNEYGYLKYVRSCKRTKASEIYLLMPDS